MFQLELAALEPAGQFFTDGLFNDARPGKADECPRFGERNITQTGKAGRDAACGGVGQHADVQPAAAVEPFQRGAGFGHLHQAENALLHPCAATGRKNDERQVLVGSVLNRTCDFFTNSGAHAAHKKTAVQHSDHRLHAADPADCCNGGFFQAGLDRSSGQLFLIIGKMQHIVGRNVRVQLFKSSVVQNRAEPIIGTDCQMHPAVGADILALDPTCRVARRPHFLHSTIAAAPSWAQPCRHRGGLSSEAALLRAGREQLFNGTHPAIPFRLPAQPDS